MTDLQLLPFTLKKLLYNNFDLITSGTRILILPNSSKIWEQDQVICNTVQNELHDAHFKYNMYLQMVFCCFINSDICYIELQGILWSLSKTSCTLAAPSSKRHVTHTRPPNVLFKRKQMGLLSITVIKSLRSTDPNKKPHYLFITRGHRRQRSQN